MKRRNASARRARASGEALGPTGEQPPHSTRRDLVWAGLSVLALVITVAVEASGLDPRAHLPIVLGALGLALVAMARMGREDR